MYSELTYSNKSLLKRFAHRRRLKIACRLLEELHPESICDFGAGDGEILLSAQKKGLGTTKNLYLYEPVLFEQLEGRLRRKAFSKIKVSRSLPNQIFEVVTCFEVLEHFDGEDVFDRLCELKSLINAKSHLIISVPIETGIAGLLKNLARIALKQTHSETTFKNMLKLTLSLKIKREKPLNGYIESHIGFDHKQLQNQIEESGLRVDRIVMSPFSNKLLSYFSSQIFFVCKVR